MKKIELCTIHQRFDRPKIAGIENTVKREMKRVESTVKRGDSIAVAVGSRGIAGFETIVRSVVDFVREAGGDPFIVPAMGSHGHATAEGQSRILSDFGICEEKIGARIVSSMEVVRINSPDLSNRVFMSRAAYEADGVVLINRIKPHTDFHGTFESGLVKMGVIGLGKHAAAMELHSFGVAGLRDLVPKAFEKLVATGKILFGIAVVENAYDETALIEAIRAEEILLREPQLLQIARRNMPRLPVEDIDVLIVDQIGKDISGVGMDPNIIGRVRIPEQTEPSVPRVRRVMVSRLTPHSQGNALGMGLADVITRKLFDAIDFTAMNINVRASLFLERVKVPLIAENDLDAFEIAFRSCGRITPGDERIVRIKDTLHLGEVQVSGKIFEEIKETVVLVKGTEPIFDEKGDLIGF